MTPTNNALPELLHCAHCGSPARLEDDRTAWAVFCTSCTASVIGDRAAEPDGTEPEAYWQHIRQTAIAAWNRRASAGPETVAFCDPSDPINSTAFAWPGTDRQARHSMPLYDAPTAPELPKQGEGGRDVVGDSFVEQVENVATIIGGELVVRMSDLRALAKKAEEA